MLDEPRNSDIPESNAASEAALIRRQVVLGNGKVVELASSRRRIGARAIDAVLGWLLASIPAIALIRVIESYDNTPGFEGLFTALVGVPLSIAIWCSIAVMYEFGFFVRVVLRLAREWSGLRLLARLTEQ